MAGCLPGLESGIAIAQCPAVAMTAGADELEMQSIANIGLLLCYVLVLCWPEVNSCLCLCFLPVTL